jgi:hypothetical protein
MNLRNLLAGLVLCAVTITYASLITTIPDRTLPNTPGPTFMPWLVAAALGTLSVLLVGQAIAGLARETPSLAGFIEVDPKGIALLAAMAILLVAIPYFGFLYSSIAFFAVAMMLYGGRQPLPIIVAAIAIPLLLQTLFRYAFSIILPAGIF